MSKYAENTEVSAEKSRGEIERTLNRYGATGFMYGWEENRALVQFKMKNRHVRFVIEMPDKKDFALTPEKRLRRTPEQQFAAWEQATRQRWRALALCVKAKLEAVESKVSTFESEFMAHIVMPDGKTVAEHVLPKIEEAYLSGEMPKLLPAIGETTLNV